MILSCPACGFSRQVPSERIPPGTKRVACPKCREKFVLPATGAAVSSAEPAEPDLPESKEGESARVTMVCPHCNVKRSLAMERVPKRQVRVTCRQCRKQFTYHGEALQAAEALVKPAQHPVLAEASRREPEPVRRRELSGCGDLLGRSWRLFLRRLPVFIGINLVSFCLAGASYLVLTGALGRVTRWAGGSVLINGIGMTLIMAFVLLVMIWSNAAAVYAVVEEDLGVRQALGYGLQRLGSFLWVYLLVWFLVAGGSLLLLIPGLIFGVWFLFAPFILAREDTRGMEALLKSKAYVTGRGWPVFGRLVLGGVLVGGISALLAPIPVLGGVAGLFLGFYLLAFYAEIQRELAEIKGNISFDCSRRTKTQWLLAGSAGFILAVGLGLALGGLS